MKIQSYSDLKLKEWYSALRAFGLFVCGFALVLWFLHLHDTIKALYGIYYESRNEVVALEGDLELANKEIELLTAKLEWCE